jgi:tryptophan synthase beta chain
MVAYDKYSKGELEDHEPTDEELQRGLDTIPHVPGIQ